MSSQFGKLSARRACFAAVFVLGFANSAQAQFGGTVQQIGGINVDPSGVVANASEVMINDFREQAQRELAGVDPAARQKASQRVISLKAIEAALKHSVESGTELPDEIKYMAGIQRLQNVIAVPEQNDILFAGPGEGWKVDELGNVVGETTGRPVIRLEDLIVALRTADAANRDYGITVSINPTQEGQKRYQQIKTAVKRQGQGFSPEMKSTFEESMGPQDIVLTGLPTDSRMAQVLVAADYQMKRIAMGLEPAAIKGMPSVLDIAEDRGSAPDSAPRFWMECSYDSVKRTEDGLAWKLEGPGAKAMSENQVINAQGEAKTVKDHPVLTQWAATMTEKFAELANADPVFGELQNVMDMAVIAAIIEKHGLLETAGIEIPNVAGTNDAVKMPKWSVPTVVASQCSFIQIRRDWMVTTSGGVKVDSWGVLEIAEVDNSLSEVAFNAVAKSNGNAWWNAVN